MTQEGNTSGLLLLRISPVEGDNTIYVLKRIYGRMIKRMITVASSHRHLLYYRFCIIFQCCSCVILACSVLYCYWILKGSVYLNINMMIYFVLYGCILLFILLFVLKKKPWKTDINNVTLILWYFQSMVSLYSSKPLIMIFRNS